jgi:predicted acylesterase/phospholipase RssA
MKFQVLDGGKLDYFEMFAGIARAHAEAMIPNFRERVRLAERKAEQEAAALGKRAAARVLQEEAFECDEEAKRIAEQMEALR